MSLSYGLRQCMLMQYPTNINKIIESSKNMGAFTLLKYIGTVVFVIVSQQWNCYGIETRSRLQERLQRLGPEEMKLLRTGRLGKSKALPFGFYLIGGQLLDATNKVVQKPVGNGLSYYSYLDKMRERAIYMRAANEAGWNFVVFQDPFYWRGSGHLILLKKVLGVNINDSPYEQEILYDAFALSLRYG